MPKHVAQMCTIFTGGTEGLTQLKSQKSKGEINDALAVKKNRECEYILVLYLPARNHDWQEYIEDS